MEEPLHSLHRAVFSERERSDFSKSVFQAKWIKYLKYFIVSAKHGRWHLHGDYIITLKTNHKVLRIYTDWKNLHLIFSLIRMALLQGSPQPSKATEEMQSGENSISLVLDLNSNQEFSQRQCFPISTNTQNPGVWSQNSHWIQGSTL